MNIDVALRDQLGLGAPSFEMWCWIATAAVGGPFNRDQRRKLEAFLHRPLPKARVRELWIAAGRRSGKDYVAARIAAYLALFEQWALSPGEVGVVLLLAVDRQQAKVAFNYIRGALEANPALWAEVANITADCITLRNGVEIQVGTADHSSVRGRTLLAVICDEFAFWAHELAVEVLRAVRPGMASQPRAMLIVISSVYDQRGPLFEAYRRFYGVDDPRVLFVLAQTRDLNPTISEEFIADEVERDSTSASAEYLSVFRNDLESFIDAALLDSVTRTGQRELPRLPSLRGGPVQYFAGVDVSGGRGDAAAAAVAHADAGKVIVDAVRYWPAPHDPLVVAGHVAEFLAEYGLKAARADQYAAEFARSAYREAGVELMTADLSRSDLYLHCLPVFTTGRVEIPDDKRLRQELLALERRTGRDGKDSVDHPPHGHDDVANAAALAIHAARRIAHVDGAVLAVRSTMLDSYADGDGSTVWMHSDGRITGSEW